MSSGEEQITYGTWKKVTELLVNTVEEPTLKTEQTKKNLRLGKRDNSTIRIFYFIHRLGRISEKALLYIENTGKLRDEYSQMCSFLN